MKFSKLAAGIALATISTGALAGGPLYIHDKTMQPYKWDTSKGPIPVWTDGGQRDGNGLETFTMLDAGMSFNQDVILADGTVLPKGQALAKDTAFLSIEQANEVTKRAVAEWTNVETSTFAMEVEGTIYDKTGIADVTGANADDVYNKELGYGFWVTYDTDGSVLEEYFGISRTMVLGIAFPEWADEETGEILEAKALMNGWFVDINDNDGSKVQGVFTHEFGHAINMSHSQANGHFNYMSAPFRPYYDGVPGCDGVNVYGPSPRQGGSTSPISAIETMFPFINVRSDAGREQGTVNVTDDIVNISDLYPTAAYKANFGSISGTLYTKDGVEYSGINMVARNINNPLYDVITQQSGNMTQGRVGPDGKFTINGLTPGEEYVLYMDTIKAGGYPTRQTAILSEPEYWNEGESSDPSLDSACAVTTISVGGGETKEVEMHFNGYTDGIQYTPLVEAFVMDHSKNGKKALGMTAGGIPFIYDTVQNDFDALVDDKNTPLLRATSVAMNKTATKAGVVADFNGNGIGQAAVWDIRSDKVMALADVTGNTCFLSSQQGKSSNAVWDMDDAGQTVVGTTRLSNDYPNGGSAVCAEGEGAKSFAIPTVWNTKNGESRPLLDKLKIAPRSYGSGWDIVIMNEDDTESRRTPWIRADRVSGNGEVITGTTNGFDLVAWVNDELHDIGKDYGARNTSVISTDGNEVAFGTRAEGVQVWNTKTDELTGLGGLEYCTDIPYNFLWFGNLCESQGAAWVWDRVGKYPEATLLDATDDLSMITARIGSFRSGITGAIYLEGVGWMSTNDFFNKQGVTEAKNLMTDNLFGLSANGSEMMGGLAGIQLSIEIDANKAFVCDNGVDMELSFPKQVVEAVKKGADFGRCAHIND
ncbi:hypothetical protein [Thalassotalea ganghwensis]